MAYAAVISLKLTVNALLNSSDPISFSRNILQLAYDEATTLQGVLERLGDDNRRSSSSERVTALEGQIRDCAHGLEDVLEFNESVEGEIGSFAEQVKRLEEEFIQELSKQDDDDDVVAAATERQDFSSNNNIDSGVELIGYSSQVFITIRDYMIAKMRPVDLHFVSLVGEVGTGTSVIAKRIFEDRVDCLFDCSAWVRVGAECELKEVLIRILAQVDNLAAGEYEWLQLDDEKVICKLLHEALKHRRYMIVLDTVRNVQLIECLKTSCPDQSNGSLVVFSTGSEEVALLADRTQNFKKPRKYFEEKAWFLLRFFCFADEPISAELEEAGIKIVQNCQGLAISVAKAYLFLDTTDKSVEKWSKLAADKHNPVFMVEDELSEVFEMKTKIQSNNERDEETVKVFDRLFVGFYDSIEILKRGTHPQRFFPKMEIISLTGMAGIGKTIFARNIYRDMSTMRHFDCHVWLTLGPKYQTEEILIDILARIYPNIDTRHMKGDAKLVSQLCEQLSDKRFLIVLDDLWSKEPLHHLKTLFPNIKGTTLLTTRLANVAIFTGNDLLYELRLLNNEESWYLLREKVFAGGFCPPEFEEGGRKIAEYCDGLPLLIVTVAEQLLKVEITLEYWTNVAIGKEKSVFMNAHDEISKALLPSYESLPQHLKACFLYMGVFRNMFGIPTSMLINLMTAEGFLESSSPHMMEAFIGECLSELVNRSLVLRQHKISHTQIKKCRHHSVFWHLSNSVAAKNKTFYAMNNRVDCSTESLKSQRRLCIRNSVLLGIKDVYNAMEESCLNLRSLLCTGLPHQYPVPLYFGSRLLRVLDALAIRFYEFPIEVVELIHLKYLGLTCNGRLPSSISQLWKLEYLIVSRYAITILPEKSSLLPDEIWDMKELKHLQVMGGCLPNPKRGDGLLKLSTLLDVNVQSCTKKVLKRIPNLKRLGIRIELAPDGKGKGNPFRSLNRISRLGRLESLKCVVVNPQMRSDYVAPPAPISMFPSSLKRLSLSGLGYPWEYMKYIGALENLEGLKLKSYAFRGPKWDTGFDIQFGNLKFIVLEDTNLECWKAGYFIELRRLSIKHCYKLQELPTSFNVLDKSPFLLEIIDCNPATISWAEEMRQIIPHYTLHISQSWIDK